MGGAWGQESPNPCRGLGAKKTGRGQGRGELTLPKQRHSIGPVFGEGKVVGDGQQSHPTGRKGAKHSAQARRALGIERGRGFIKEEYGGPKRQGPGDGDPLLLPPGKGARLLMRNGFQADLGEGVPRSNFRFPRAQPLCRTQG